MIKNTERILLISLNREKLPVPVLPLGMAFLIPALEKRKIDFRLVDLCFKENPCAALAAEIKEYAPDIICIGIRNIDDESMLRQFSHVPYIKEIITVCRRNSGSRIITGGAGFSLMYREFFRELNPDIGVIGEGEEILCDVLDNADNLHWLRSREYLITRGDSPAKHYAPYRADTSLNTLAPARNCFEPDYYNWKSGIKLNMVPVQTRRGCCFSCSYCAIPGLEGKRIRLRNIELVLEELKWLVKNRMHEIFFVDNVFNYPPEYATELCRKIMEQNIRISWMCYLSPKNLPPGLAGLMQAAGCTAVYSGTDHLVDKILDALEKGYSFNELERTNNICRTAGLRTVHYLLTGGPGENDHSLTQCLERVHTLHCSAVFFSAGIRVYPGTALYARAEAEGIIGPDMNPLYPVFYFSREIRLNSLSDKLKRIMAVESGDKIIKCTFPLP